MAAPGIPWRRWCSSWDACDCWGLLSLWHREVLGVDLGGVPQTTLADGWPAVAGDWRELPGPEAHATIWMAWRDGAPMHCGVLIDAGRVLHAEANEATGAGSVRITRLPALLRIYGTPRYYRHTRC